MPTQFYILDTSVLAISLNVQLLSALKTGDKRSICINHNYKNKLPVSPDCTAAAKTNYYAFK